MADPFPGIPKPPGPPPETPHAEFEPVDLLAYSVGGTALVLSQLYSSSQPHLAQHVAKNTVGLDMALGKGKVGATVPNLSLMLAPAPFGFVHPHSFDLESNYLYKFNKGIDTVFTPGTFPKLPDSDLFKTLPDNNPEVLAELYRLQGTRQIRALRAAVATAPNEEVLRLYTLAQSPQGQQHFFRPADVAEDLAVTLRSRLGTEAADPLLREARQVDAFRLQLPLDQFGPTSIPQPVVYVASTNVIPQHQLRPPAAGEEAALAQRLQATNTADP